MELNGPFYSWPTTAAVRAWLRQAGSRSFVYTVKVSELITHVKQFTGTRALVRDFGYIADLLGPRMGCFLFQLLPDETWSSSAIAVGGTKTFSPPSVLPADFLLLQRAEAARRAGQDRGRNHLRFHGTRQWYRHDYSSEELAGWATKIQASGATRVWAYFNNDREGYAIENARSLLRQLQGTKICR